MQSSLTRLVLFSGENAKLTWAAELGEEQSRPRGQIVGEQGAVRVPEDIGGDEEEAIPGRVDDEAKGGVAGQVNLVDQRDFVQDRVRRVVDGDGDLKDAAGEGGDEEAVVEGVPL
ncbi:hypothetical protein TIFTF001_054846, partial [Ficus carica]